MVLINGQYWHSWKCSSAVTPVELAEHTSGIDNMGMKRNVRKPLLFSS